MNAASTSPHGAPAWGRLLLSSLLLLTAYRLWIIPHLGVTLYIDEAQYWTWAQQPDWGYFSKPPVVAWLIAASTTVFGNGLLAVKLPSLLLYPATSWVLYRLGTRLFDARTGFRCGLAFALVPIVSALGLAVSTDAPLLFCWAAAMLVLLRALENDRLGDWLLLGLLVGIGLMAKYTMAAFGASAALYMLAAPERRRLLARPGPWLAIVLALLCLLPNILWNWSHDFPTLRHTADITHVAGENLKRGNLGEFLGAQAGSLGPGFALAFLCALPWALRRLRQSRQQFLLAFSLPLLLLVTLQAARSEANGNWAAPALIAALVLGVAWLGQWRARWWVAALALNVVVMLGAYHLGDYFLLSGKPQPAKLDPLKRAKGWTQLAAPVGALLREHPGAVLLTPDRTLAAHMLYELRAQQPEFRAWAPGPHPIDHYQLTRPLTADDAARSFLLVTSDDYSAIAQRFEHATELAFVNTEVEPGLSRSARVVWLEGFRGYAPRP